MTDRERLIELINDCRSMDGYGMELVEKQADYLLANGITVPPCPIGTKIFMLVTRKTLSFEIKNKRMTRLENQHTFIKETYLTKSNFFKVLEDYGKTVFLKEEDAECALNRSKACG